MPREYAPEDNPWSNYTSSSTWQDMVRAGDMARLPALPRAVTNQSLNYTTAHIMWSVDSIDNFLGWAHVDFTRPNELCILDRTDVEKIWVEIQNDIMFNLINVVPSPRQTANDGEDINVKTGGREYTVMPDGKSWQVATEYTKCVVNWPNLGSITTPVEIENGFSQMELNTSKNLAALLKPYTDMLTNQDAPNIEKLRDVFSTPLQYTTPEGVLVFGLLVANKTVKKIIETEESMDEIYDFYLVPQGSSYSYAQNVEQQIAEALMNRGSRLALPGLPSGIINTSEANALNNGQRTVASDSVYTAVENLNNQIGSYLQEFSTDSNPLSFSKVISNLLSSVHQGVKYQLLVPRYCRDEITTELNTLTGKNAHVALRVIQDLREVKETVENQNINFVGYTGSDIPIGWSYPISNSDVRNIYYPSSNRGTSLKTIHQTQIEIPEVLLTFEDLDYLDDIFTAIQALQSRLPNLERSIADTKTRLEKNRAHLSSLLDPETTRLKVNAAAQAARAQTRERLARDIEIRERNITNELVTLERYHTEKQALIDQFLNE